MKLSNVLVTRMILGLALSLLPANLLARVEIAPYASVSSTKKIKPADVNKEKSTTQQKATYGIRFGLGLTKMVKIQGSVGQSETTTKSRTQDAADSFDEINYERDLDMSTDDPEREVMVKETQRQARLGLVFDPSFSIFIARVQGGVQATQRLMEMEQDGLEPTKYESPITYKPYAGAGLGVRFSPRIKAMAEYNFHFYKFPEFEPFEREVAISFIISI